MSLIFSRENVEFEGKKIHGGLLELENAVLTLIWEGEEPKLGSTTVTLPGMTSTQIIGDRDQLLGRILGEYVASKFNRISLVSTNISQGYSEGIGRTLMELIKKIVEEKRR